MFFWVEKVENLLEYSRILFFDHGIFKIKS
jgi:hypothetical protein